MTDTEKVKIEPCPMPGCGGECTIESISNPFQTIYCVSCIDCTYRGIDDLDEDMAIAAHNQHCERNRLGKAAKKLQENPPFQKIDMIDTAMTYEEVEQADAHNNGIWACLDFFKVESGE